nr:sialidase family protein [uncultured Flavobacterium sp.]
MMNSSPIYSTILALIILSCTGSNNDDAPIVNPPTPIVEKTIEWDQKTLVQVSEANSTDYNGYARLIELADKSLVCTYESAGNIVIKKSTNSGATWGATIKVVSGNNDVNMATPDILLLKDNSILICYNPRPKSGSDPSKKFEIRTIKSNDNGLTWKEDQLIYEASSSFENGCWEPSAIQLPSGEIQLFFSNENMYQSSAEQNISLVRSTDSGTIWSTSPEIVSFRTGSRDGMPSPILLKDQNEIVFSIEDNGVNNQFKPYIIRNTIAENWKTTVEGNSANRNYALSNTIDNANYAGAPYLAQLSTGEVLLSYQSTENRTNNDINNAIMKVAVGTNKARDFKGKSTPFTISTGKSALWNSISVLKDDTVIALTTTNQFSGSNASQIWMIKGHLKN